MELIINARRSLANALLVVFVSVITAVPVMAAPTVDDIWTAADISGISAKVIPMAVLIVGIALVGTALAIGVKAIKKSRGAL